MEWREKRRKGSARSFLQGPAMKRLAGCRGGTTEVAVRKKWRRRVLGREEERSMGIGVGWERREELSRGPEKEIDRRKWVPQPSQNWQRTAQFSESGTAGH